MSAPKHTPAPWSVGVNKDETFYEVQASEGELVAYLGGSSFPVEVDAANAALMAAAPELLEGLREALAAIEVELEFSRDPRDGSLEGPRNRITQNVMYSLESWRAALRKAEGET